MSLETAGLFVTLGKREILRGIDMKAEAGKITAIVGPNGSGKTTLMRALTGDVAYRGQVWLGGKDCATLDGTTLATRRAVLPQAATLTFPFTVLEVVRLGLTAGISSDHLTNHEARVLEALERVGLGGFEGRMFHDLSGGEKQRVHLARVLVQIWQPVLNGQARWLLLDEPVSALDIGHQLLVMNIARDYAQSGGGVIAVMHDLNLTAMFADQILLLDDGRLRASGQAADVLNDANLTAAYGCQLSTNTAPVNGVWVLPQAAAVAREWPQAGYGKEPL